ncbi:MAG: response regulator [Planctomycetota bacterium]|jgi:two-component system response regulator
MTDTYSKVRKNIILLVEDDPDDVELILRSLNKNNINCDIKVAKDGAEALDYLFCTGPFAGRDTPEKPILILLDLKLPKINGMAVLEIIRNDERTKSLPVFILSSSNEENDVIESYNKGANRYINKSLDLNLFIETVRQLQYNRFLPNKSPSNQEDIVE